MDMSNNNDYATGILYNKLQYIFIIDAINIIVFLFRCPLSPVCFTVCHLLSLSVNNNFSESLFRVAVELGNAIHAADASFALG